MPTPKKKAARAKPAPPKVDPHDPQALRERIVALTQSLRLNARRETAARAVLRRIAAQRQKLKAWRARRSTQLDAISGNARKRVIRAALAYVGETENPAGSNRGPGIVSRCQRYFLGYDGVAWCGCFGGYLLKTVGKVPMTSRVAYCPFNVIDAQQAQSTGKVVNGWKGVRSDKAKAEPGDCAMMDWQHDGTADHFVILKQYLGGGVWETIEGNTSFDNAGSQSNGGCVAIKRRSVNDMQAVCIPAYPA